MDVDEMNQNSKKVGRAQIVVTIISVLAILFIAFTYKDSQKSDIQILEDQAVQDQTWPSSEVDKATINESTRQYDINVVYPVVKDKNISLLIKGFVESQINQFKQDTAWVNDASISSASEGELSISINYEKQNSDNTETYIFNTSTYTGGAHGMQFTNTMTFSKLGKFVRVENLFTNAETGLKLVSDYVKTELMKGEYADASTIASGASPTKDNYQSFYITDEGVTFIFDPYQVAPYSAGPQRVTVPVNVFKAVVNKDIF